ncbi:S-adenosyl-L-methionine-dependent methyltransferase [Clavulina sp. PMI_390]|nr:S-adenosyl-L-methionine-dependent methyltransferase [Clavulina sp. PMI_390]
MSTFSKAVFNTARYANFRPTYPKSLFEEVYKYHGSSPTASWGHALDLGCGTGQATTVLAERFDSATGVDPSAGMVSTARETNASSPGKMRFEQSSAEALPLIASESVDLVTAAQAAHWFKYDQLWPELGRVLRKGGSVAFWNYSEFRLSKHPRLTTEINAYASDPTQNLGPYWEQPGRGILDNHLQAIKFPTDGTWDLASAQRVYFVGNQYPTAPIEDPNAPISNSPIRLSANDQHREVILKKTVSWDGLDSYLRTWSPLVAYWEAHADDKANPSGDIVKRFTQKLRDEVEKDLGGNPGEEVELEWPLALIMIRKAN